MRILMALPYGPTRTRLRSRMLLDELSRRHDVTLVNLAWGAEDVAATKSWGDRLEKVVSVPHRRTDIARAFARRPKLPLQYQVSRSPEMAATIRALVVDAQARQRPFAAVHIEHLRGAAAADLTAGMDTRIVFDAVDCIAELARQARRSSPSSMVRIAARLEEASTRRLECQIVSIANATTVVAERDRDALIVGGAPPNINVVPNGVVARETPVPLTDSPTIVFTGKLSYHANDAALRWFVTNVFPRIRGERPDTKLLVAGANAPTWLHQASPQSGIELIENPEAVEPWIERARVAVAPVQYSVGVQNKVLEAFGRGVPVVATRSAADGLFDDVQDCLLIADRAEEFATQVIRLLNDRSLSTQIGRRGHQSVKRRYSWTRAATAFEDLYSHAPMIETMKVA